MVREGDLEIKREYLRIAFSDEGSVGKSHGYPCLIMARYKHINKILTENQIKILDKFVEPEMRSRKFPTGHIIKYIRIRETVEILEKINEEDIISILLEDSIPALLLDESEIYQKILELRIQLTPLNLRKLKEESIV